MSTVVLYFLILRSLNQFRWLYHKEAKSMKVIQLAALSVIVFNLAFNTAYAQSKTKLVFSTIEGSVNAEVSSQVMIEAYKRIGVEIEILALPGKRTLIVSNSGELDGELFRLDNP